MSILTALMGFFFLSGAMSVLPTSAQAPQTPARPNHAVTLTAYNAVPEQTDNDPFVTASGAYSNPEVIAARSRDLAEELPFGTIVELDGPLSSQNTCGYGIVSPIIGYRIIADTMSARYTNRIDILFSTKSNYLMNDGRVKNAGAVLGICSDVTLRVVGHLNSTYPSTFPATQIELAAIVGGTGLALR